MRIVLFDDHRVGVLDGDTVRDVSPALPRRWRQTPYAINALIESWDELRQRVECCLATAQPVPVSAMRLLAPVPRPRQLLAAPLNYRRHVAEMVGARHAPTDLTPSDSAGELGFFVKAAGSICGPHDAIELPRWPERSFHHEVELGVVIGRRARGLTNGDAPEHIFGYVCLLDITLRTDGQHQEERTMRKSFDTFTPIGPCLVTADEIEDPASLDVRLWVNDELRQSANTRDLLVGVDDLIAAASRVLTLHPGDVYATGTPEGVGPIVPGDVVRASVERVGELELPVTQRDW
jgi:2-keto-4-pentenoate hydratase/2-oxohepta-3-ene-1,7-dioic acid hydratase in catechol pathway